MTEQDKALVDALREAECYFSERADAEYSTESASPFGNEEMRLLGIVQQAIATPKAVAPAGEVVPNGKLVGWWNGVSPGVDSEGIVSIRWGADGENSHHDIPLYDGYNPIHYATPPAQGAVTEAMVERACALMWSSWGNPKLQVDSDRDRMRMVLEAALTAAPEDQSAAD